MLLLEMLNDPNALLAPKAITLAALVYVISPIDATPDLISYFRTNRRCRSRYFGYSTIRSYARKI